MTLIIDGKRDWLKREDIIVISLWQMDIATTLLEYGAKANAESKAGFTPLHLSAQEGHTDMSTLLIEHKADTNHKAKVGEGEEEHDWISETTTFHFISCNPLRHKSLRVKACLSSLQNGLTPLHLCAQEDKVNVASILVKNGAQIDAKTKVRRQFDQSSPGYMRLCVRLKTRTRRDRRNVNDCVASLLTVLAFGV